MAPLLPRISVVIPCYNAAPWIAETLRSVMQQGGDAQIIVVDDGSTDTGVQEVMRVCPQAQVLRTARQGPSVARNTGTAHAHGEFIQYLDADDLLVPGKWEAQCAALQRDAADVAYGDWQYLLSTPRGFVKGELVRRQMHEPDIELFTDFWCPPAAYLFRAEMVQRVGGFREDLPVIQDARFALDCALQGGTFTYCSGLSAYYRVHKGARVSAQAVQGLRDRLRNAEEVMRLWQAHDWSNRKREAVRSVLAALARSSYRRDKDTFEKTYMLLRALDPDFLPDGPFLLRVLTKAVGYPAAEECAFWCRVLTLRGGAS